MNTHSSEYDDDVKREPGGPPPDERKLQNNFGRGTVEAAEVGPRPRRRPTGRIVRGAGSPGDCRRWHRDTVTSSEHDDRVNRAPGRSPPDERKLQNNFPTGAGDTAERLRSSDRVIVPGRLSPACLKAANPVSVPPVAGPLRWHGRPPHAQAISSRRPLAVGSPTVGVVGPCSRWRLRKVSSSPARSRVVVLVEELIRSPGA